MYPAKVAVILAVTLSTVCCSPTGLFQASDRPEDVERSEDFRNSGGVSDNFDSKPGYDLADSMGSSSFQTIPVYHHQASQELRAAIRENGQANPSTTSVGTDNVSSAPTSSSMQTNASSAVLLIRNETENCTLEPAFLCLMDLVHFQRDKAVRINAIKDYVIRKLGMTAKAPHKPSNHVDRNNPFEQIGPSSPFSGQLETLYASCDVPSNVDADTWYSSQSFNVYFSIPPSMYQPLAPTPPSAVTGDDGSNESIRNFQAMMLRQSPYPKSGETPRRTNVGENDSAFSSPPLSSRRRGVVKNSNVISAKLKLYKIGRGARAESLKFEDTNPAEPCNDTAVETAATAASSANFQNINGIEEKIRVSVYWYTLPAKKNQLKKKLLDTKMLSVKESRWIEFDIQRAAAIWLEKRENYGLVVQVENEDNEMVETRKFFAALPCTAVTSLKNGSASTNSNETTHVSVPQVIDILPPPVLEICTLSLPTSGSVPASQNIHADQRRHHVRNGHRHRHSHGETHPSSHHRSRNNNPNQLNLRQKGQMNTETVEDPLYSHLNITESETSPKSLDSLASQSTEKGFLLDEDHPLREILATVASSNESRQKKDLNQEPDGEMQHDVDYNEDYDDNKGSNDREIIVQKIYISPPAPHHHQSHQSPSSLASSSAHYRRGHSDLPGTQNR